MKALLSYNKISWCVTIMDAYGLLSFLLEKPISTNTSKMNALVPFGEGLLFEVFTKFFLWLVVDSGFLFLFELISLFRFFFKNYLFHLSFQTN